jgi:hypothetical protein
MNERGFWRLDGVSDARLQSGLKELLANGARTEARIVAHLAEVDARKLHLTMGASSLFDYCLTRLGLSNNEAFHRITAARLARKFPVIFELLERRDVHLTAVCLLRDYLTPENHLELLRDVSHKTKLEIEELLARRFPRPDVASGLSRLPGRGPRAFEPLSEGRYRLQLNASGRLKEKLELARDLMSHANPSGDLAVVVERALDVLIERLEARRFAQTKCRPEEAGIVRSAAARSGAARSAAVRSAAARSAAARSGAARSAAVRSAAADGAVVGSEAVGSEAARNGAARNGAARNGALGSEAARNGAARSEALCSDKVPSRAEESSGHNGARGGSVAAGNGSAPSGAARDGSGDEAAECKAGRLEMDPLDALPHEAKPHEPEPHGAALYNAGGGGSRSATSVGGRANKTGRAHVAHDVRRQVIARDGHRCTFVSDDGQRCTARAFLQFHHRTAWAKGGVDTAQNLSVLCRAHNRLVAERELGTEHVAAAIEMRRRRAG